MRKCNREKMGKSRSTSTSSIKEKKVPYFIKSARLHARYDVTTMKSKQSRKIPGNCTTVAQLILVL